MNTNVDFELQTGLFQLDAADEGEGEQWFSSRHDRSDWLTAGVPRAWDFYTPALYGHEGVGWYGLILPENPSAEQRHREIVFEGVSGFARVWVNGHFAAEHLGVYLPFTVNLDAFWNAEGPNLAVVRVDNRHQEDWLPGNAVVEWMQYGGLVQPVILRTTPLCRVADVAISTEISGTTARVLVDVELENSGAVSAAGWISCSVGDVRGESDVTVPPQAAARIILELPLVDAALWSPQSPTLHDLEISWWENGVPVDARTERFGVRTISTRGRDILLNGEPITIRGVNRYDEFPDFGPTVPTALIRQDLLRIKQMGANLVRTHFPPSRKHLEILDEIGLLLMEEVPLNWWLSRDAVYQPIVVDRAEEALAGMIRRDRNHPCLIAWSMANESETHLPEGIAGMRRLLRKAKELDSSRLVTFVSKGEPGHEAYDEADLVCINLYYGLFSEAGRIGRIAEFEDGVREATRRHLESTKREFPGKPVLLTEFGNYGIAGLRGDVPNSEAFQAAYLESVWQAVVDAKIQGGVVWSWADYPHRKSFTHTTWDTAYGPFGLVTAGRKPKLALAAMCRLFGGDPAAIENCPAL